MSGDRAPEVLTSAANPRVRAALDLRERRGRERSGRILVDGAREIARALDGGARVLEVFVDAEGPRSEEGIAVVERLVALGVAPTPVAGPARDRLPYGDRVGDLVAIAVPPPTTLDLVAAAVAAAPDPLIVVVEDPEKPGNLGAIARSADGAGATAIVAAVRRRPPVDAWNPNAIRASLGTVFTVPLAIAPTDEVLDWLKGAGIRIAAALVEATTLYHDVNLRGPLAIAVGSEATGLGPAWTAPGIEGLRIPMHGRADSLNLGVAAAILLFEARRQRDSGGGPVPIGKMP